MPKEHRYFVYLLTNWNNKVMYVGVTNNLERRIYEHKNKMVQGFTEKYNVSKLVYFEEASDVASAISREKEIKKWRREKKDALAMTVNPEWKDLSDGWFKISPFGRNDKGVGRNDKETGRDDKGVGRNDKETGRDDSRSVISRNVDDEKSLAIGGVRSLPSVEMTG